MTEQRNGRESRAGRDRRSFERIDRRMAVAFGVLLTAVLLIAFFVGSALYVASVSEQRERLSTVVATAMRESFARLSFSGRHHVRLLVEDIAKADERIAYVSLVSPEGVILADSEPGRNGSRADRETVGRVSVTLGAGGLSSFERIIDDEPVREVAFPVHGGFRHEVIGVAMIGVREEPLRTTLLRAAEFIGGVLLVLLLISIPLLYLLSRWIGGPVKQLASELEGILRHAPLLVGIQGPDGRLERSSARLRERFGLLPGQRPELDALIPPPPTGRENGAGEVRVAIGDEERVLLVSRFPVERDAEGRAERICMIAVDVTAERTAQDERDRLAGALVNTVDHVLIADTDATIVYANAAFEKANGWVAEEIVGHSINSTIKPAEGMDDLYAEAQDAVRNGQAWRGQVMARSKDGREYPIRVTGSPILDRQGQTVAMAWIARDVSREEVLERQLFQSQKMDAVGRLAGGIAHDFNNLLTVISGECGLLQLESDLPPNVLDAIRSIEETSDRAAALTKKLLAFSRRQLLDLKPHDLNTLVTGAQHLVGRAVGEGVTITLGLAPDLWPVKVDQGQIEQVLLNLAINARDAMGGAGRFAIETNNREFGATDVAGIPELPVGDYVVVSVSDTGQGMTQEIVDKVFEPFFTTKEPGSGTGLGLATVHGIVRQSGGHIWVYSEPGLGTTFHVAFPRFQGEREAEEAAVAEARAEAPAGGSETILVVEDNADVRTTIVRILAPVGYHILQAGDGREALELLADLPQPPDLVLSDVLMPRMGGPELARELRQRLPGMPIIFLSGYSRQMGDEEVDLGDAPLLQKPPSVAELRAAVRKALD